MSSPVPRDPGDAWTLPALRIDADGDWWDGAERITHPGILANLSAGLSRDAGGYFIQTRVRVPVSVEDTPVVVGRIERCDGELWAWVSDGRQVLVDPATLRISDGNVPYCTVPPEFPARLTRAATFQLLDLVGEDGVLRLGDRTYAIPGLAAGGPSAPPVPL
jgi:hypothetical protein